jgi:hypothetical protein
MPGQSTYTAVCVGLLIAIFLTVKVKALANTTIVLLLLAFFSYLAGLFTPQVPFMDLSPVMQNLFSAQYCFCYLIIALLSYSLLCWKINRSWGEGLLAGAFAVLSLVLTYLSARTMMPPDTTVFVKGVLYISFLLGFGAFYYVVSRQTADKVILPILLLLLAVGGLWLYTISGPQRRIQANVSELAAYTKSKPLADANVQIEKAFGINSKREVLSSLNPSNEYTELSTQEVQNKLSAELVPLTKNTLDERMQNMLLEMTAAQHKEGRALTKIHIWRYASTVPFVAFASAAAENHAYFFLIFLLFVFGLLVCVESILFGEEYE